MPELPEVEHLRRTLEPQLVGRHVRSARLHRRDVLRKHGRCRGHRDDLLVGCRVERLQRLGKQLAIVSDTGRVVCVHLGMTGRLWCVAGGGRLADRRHVHCVWWHSPATDGGVDRLVFQDARRFGGLWAFPSIEALRDHRWSRLGPDAMDSEAGEIADRLGGTSRSVKAALLDQGLVAGVGNIYADEALHAAGIDPVTAANRIPPERLLSLCTTLRSILSRAVLAGGSTVRDYRDGNGQAGTFVSAHAVYGRAGEPCRSCGRPLATRCDSRTAGRTTVYCETYQHRF